MLIDLIGRVLCHFGLHWFEPVAGLHALKCARCPEIRQSR